MVQRKGQFIVNHIRFNLKIPEERIWSYLFNMHDEELLELEREYRLYIIKELHKPDRQARQEDLNQIVWNMKSVDSLLKGDK